MKNREKELKYLIYLKGELIKQTKKEIKQIQQEINTINSYKKLEKTNCEVINKVKVKRR